MKKFLCVMAILFTASCSSQGSINISQLPPAQENTSISSNADKVSYLGDGNSTIVNKEPAIKRLTNNQITVEKTVLLEPTNELYVISFSKGAGVGTIGQLVMYIDKTGKSYLSMRGNYHNNKPTKLTFDETKKLLRSASNYKSNVDKLGKLFGN